MRAQNVTLATLFVTSALSLSAAPAFAEGISAGAGLAYGTGVDEADGEFALQLNGYYDLGAVVQNLRVGGAFNYFFIDDPATLWALNVNAQYVFVNQDALLAYGLAGLNLTHLAVEAFGFEVSDEKLGLNLGAGGEYSVVPEVGIYAEIKYVLSSWDQAVISVGGRYRF